MVKYHRIINHYFLHFSASFRSFLSLFSADIIMEDSVFSQKVSKLHIIFQSCLVFGSIDMERTPTRKADRLQSPFSLLILKGLLVRFSSLFGGDKLQVMFLKLSFNHIGGSNVIRDKFLRSYSSLILPKKTIR